MGFEREHRLLLRQIFSVIGAASLAGCATRNVGDGGASDGADASTSGDAQTESEDGEGEGESTSSSEGSGPLDIYDPTTTDTDDPTDQSDTDGGELCGPFIDPWTVEAEPPPPWCEPLPDWGYAPVCFFPPDGMSCEDEPQAYECIIDAYSCGLISGGMEVHCGPYTTPEGACCYVVLGECAVGRPFCVDGRARVAALVEGANWGQGPRPDTIDLDTNTRAALADAWRRCGQSEHASIASFARFTSELLALGAPARLIAASLAAGADERRHALRCFALADAYAGAPRGPDALAIASAIEARDPVAIAVSLASEGCVAETVSLMLLCAALERAEDRAVRRCLAEMIADERRHVLLAWEALAWLCAGFGEQLRDAVARVFGEAERHVGFGARTGFDGEVESMRAHGYLAIAEREAVAVEALRELVLPGARRLLARHSTIAPTPSR